MQATRAALHEGILPGGGVALLNAQAAIDTDGPRARRGDRRARSCAARSRSRCARSPPTPASSPSVVVAAVRALSPGRRARRRDRCLRRPRRGGRDRPDARHPLRARARRLDREDRARHRVHGHARRPARTTWSREAQGGERPRPIRSFAGRRASCSTAPTRARPCSPGIDAVADTVKVTLGPRGRNVVLATPHAAPDDHERRRHDRRRDRARRLVPEPGRAVRAPRRLGHERGRRRRHDDRHACWRRRSSARGSGTSPRAPTRWRSGAGSSGPSSRPSATCATSSRGRSASEQLARVATISAGDEEIGDVIADAIEQVGNDGALSVQDGQTVGIELELTRRDALRPRLAVAGDGHRRGAHGGGARLPLHPARRPEARLRRAPRPDARPGRGRRASRCSWSPR